MSPLAPPARPLTPPHSAPLSPRSPQGALCAFRCIYCLKTGDRPGSIAWGLKAADAFGCADPDALLDLSVIDAAVHTMEALRRQGHVSEIVALRSLLMYQTKVRLAAIAGRCTLAISHALICTCEHTLRAHLPCPPTPQMFPIAAYIVAKNSTRPDFLLPFESAVMPFPPGLYLRKHRPGQLPSPSPASATEVEFPADGISWDGTHATGYCLPCPRVRVHDFCRTACCVVVRSPRDCHPSSPRLTAAKQQRARTMRTCWAWGGRWTLS